MDTPTLPVFEDEVEAPNIILQCRYCLRVQDGQAWTQFMTLLRYYNLSASDVFLAETYCEPCAAASHQLLTYGPLGPSHTRQDQRDRHKPWPQRRPEPPPPRMEGWTRQ